MRVAWNGAISLGGPMMLANFAAFKAMDDKPEGTSFRQLCPACDKPINQIKVCRSCGQTDLATADLHAGYEVEKDRFVVLQKDELAAVDQADNKTIAVVKFVDTGSISPMRVDKAYYLAPRKGDATKPAFGLIRDTLAEVGKAALGTVTLEKRTQLAAVLAAGKGLILYLLSPKSLVRPQAEVPGLEDIPVAAPAFVGMAKQIVAMMQDDEADLEVLADERAVRIQELIKAKMAGQPLSTPTVDAPAAAIMDLEAALTAALAAVKAAPKVKKVPVAQVQVAAEAKKKGKK
jgi:DNA end-binding protein Ku